MLEHNRATALRREFTAADRIPYTAHVAPTVVRTHFGDYLQVLRLGGASFESNDDEELNNWHERLNVLWRNVGSPNVALWTQVIRRRAGIPPSSEETAATRQSGRPFAGALHTKYRSRLTKEILMTNEVYLAVVYRPTSGMATSVVSKILARVQRDRSPLDVGDALDACEKLAQTLSASLARYEPDLLGTYRWGQVWCSSLLEYLGLLINGEWQRAPLPSGPLNHALATSRLFFGTEAIEYRSPTATRVGAMLGIKEYPTPSVVENCANTLILRCSGSENGGTSQFASRLIGDREILRRQVSRGSDRDSALSSRGARRSRSITEQHATETAVMPSELEQLPDLCGYLKRASAAGWLKVAFGHRLGAECRPD
jgi:type IV secretion system protein VirB4